MLLVYYILFQCCFGSFYFFGGDFIVFSGVPFDFHRLFLGVRSFGQVVGPVWPL